MDRTRVLDLQVQVRTLQDKNAVLRNASAMSRRMVQLQNELLAARAENIRVEQDLAEAALLLSPQLG
jgi:hypothetical protein